MCIFLDSLKVFYSFSTFISFPGGPPEALPEARQQSWEGPGGGEGSPPHPPADSYSCPAPGCVSEIELSGILAKVIFSVFQIIISTRDFGFLKFCSGCHISIVVFKSLQEWQKYIKSFRNILEISKPWGWLEHCKISIVSSLPMVRQFSDPTDGISCIW